MGGYGSGKWFRWSKKDSTGDCRALDVRRWQRDGYLTPGQSFAWNWTREGETVASIGVKTEAGRLILSYTRQHSGEEPYFLEYPVGLDWTACHYGGQRAWLRCPAQGCGRRVALLYLAGKYFACRHCYRLAYPSQRESACDRAARQANKIRGRLGWRLGVLNPDGSKPKGMHWKTFQRLHAEQAAFQQKTLVGLMAQLTPNR